MTARPPWPYQTLTTLEGHDWGEPGFPSSVVTRAHDLRHKPLRDFTPDDLRFMVVQRISLPTLLPMALDVLEAEPFVAGGSTPGALLAAALRVDPRFWEDYPEWWYRLNVIVADLSGLRELLEQELVPAAAAFEKLRPNAH